MEKPKKDNFIVFDESSEIPLELLKNLKTSSRTKLKFENGSSISFQSVDLNEGGRGLRPFVPHPCQEEEFALSRAKFPIHDLIIQDMNSKINNDFMKLLEAYIKKGLKQWGFEFKSDEEFYDFIKKRVRRVVFDDLEEVHYYVDFVDLENRGKQIGLTNENRVSFDFDKENMKFTATIG